MRGDCCGRENMIVGFTTTCAISAYHHESLSFNPAHGEVYSIKHYVISLSVTWFPPPIKLNPKIHVYTHYTHSVVVQDFVSGRACCVNQYHYESR